jgi:hypothetical protein
LTASMLAFDYRQSRNKQRKETKERKETGGDTRARRSPSLLHPKNFT